VPETVKWGRYGDWLRGNVDWSLSRSRYWGTPLPVWVCPDDHETAVSSIADLAEKAGRDLADLDPHRPFVDDVTITCGHDGCGRPATRVSEVIDVWYDSGAMPFAQFGYPHASGSTDVFDSAYPAQYICEAIDQTRGWFYSLMAVGTLVFDRSSYENVVCLGHILAEDGRKMSKHLGNVIAPMPLLDQHGADAVRWFMLCSGSPWNARRVGHGNIEEVVRKVVLGLWNTAAFFTLYAEVGGWDPTSGGSPAAPEAGGSDPLDAWVRSKLATLVGAVTDALDAFDTAAAGKALAAFLDDLSNWYVRRSRRRFWDGDAAALATLHEVLHTVVRLMAPFTPFVAEEVWRAIRLDGDVDSVHLADWPAAEAAAVDAALEEQVELVRRIVELGRSARASQKVKTRQPLARALVGGPGWDDLPDDLREAVAAELNVQSVDGLGSATTLVDISAKPNFRTLGAKHGAAVQAIAAAVRDADAAQLAAALASGTASVEVDGAPLALDAEDVIVTESPREGWAVASGETETIALDLTLTPELVALGHAREVVRLVQDGRKQSGFDVSDRVELWWTADGELAESIDAHRDAIADEVLAVSFERGAGPAGLDPAVVADGLSVWLRVAAPV
jgi:isoleucyl-tRNA synthetase